MNRGLVQVYYGEGKGKSTAALGLTVRALGAGLTVKLFQFCKSTPTAELVTLKRLDRVEIWRADWHSAKFTWDMTEEEKLAWREAQLTLFEQACEAACDPEVDMVVLDEALGAVEQGAVPESQLLYLLKHKYRGTELVLTGRVASRAILDEADYATEMRCEKHPYAAGVPARKGIEY